MPKGLWVGRHTRRRQSPGQGAGTLCIELTSPVTVINPTLSQTKKLKPLRCNRACPVTGQGRSQGSGILFLTCSFRSHRLRGLPKIPLTTDRSHCGKRPAFRTTTWTAGPPFLRTGSLVSLSFSLPSLSQLVLDNAPHELTSYCQAWDHP